MARRAHLRDDLDLRGVAFRDTVTCVFTGPRLRFTRSVNVNSAETELPTLTGETQG